MQLKKGRSLKIRIVYVAEKNESVRIFLNVTLRYRTVEFIPNIFIERNRLYTHPTTCDSSLPDIAIFQSDSLANTDFGPKKLLRSYRT